MSTTKTTDNNDYKEDSHDDDNVVDRNKKIKFANFDFEQKNQKDK